MGPGRRWQYGAVQSLKVQCIRADQVPLLLRCYCESPLYTREPAHIKLNQIDWLHTCGAFAPHLLCVADTADLLVCFAPEFSMHFC